MAGRNIYVVDLDGTLYDNRHREALIPKDRSCTEEWVAFNNACLHDAVREPVRRMVECLLDSGDLVIFLTGRGSSARIATAQCLMRDFPFHQPGMKLRPMDDHRPAADFKTDYLKALQLKHPGKHIVAIEDDVECVAAMRQIPGVTVLQIDSLCVAHTTGQTQGVENGR